MKEDFTPEIEFLKNIFKNILKKSDNFIIDKKIIDDLEEHLIYL